MNMELKQNYSGRIALEVVRGNKSVTFIQYEGGSVILRRWDDREFAKEFCKTFPDDVSEPEKPTRRYARCFLTKTYLQFEEGALAILLDIMGLSVAERENCEFVTMLNIQDCTVVGHYCDGEDAALVASHMDIEPMYIREMTQLKTLKPDKLAKLWKNIAEGKALPKDPTKLRKGIFDMATKKEQAAPKAAKKVEQTTKERVRKTDGPVAQIHAYLDKQSPSIKGGSLTRKDVTAALLLMGINKGTIGVQVGKWVANSGVNFVKPQPAAKPVKEKAAASTTPVEAKAVKKPVAAKKPAAKGKK